jgi:hypothetical protein
MSRAVTVSDELAEALEAAGAVEGTAQAQGAVAQAIAGRDGPLVRLIRLLPQLGGLFGNSGLLTLIQLLPQLGSLLGGGAFLKVLQALPPIVNALKAGNYGAAFNLALALIQELFPNPAPAQSND